MKKRVLSLLMAFVLCLGLSVMAGAEDAANGGQTGNSVVKVVSKDAVTSYYDNLADALNGAPDGATVTLLEDYALKSSPTIVEKSITLNLNGKSIDNDSVSIAVGDDDWSNHTYRTGALKIIGSGSINGPVLVCVKSSLDLSEWEGGTIKRVSLNDFSSCGEGVEREPALTVGPNAGRIEALAFSNWNIGKISKTTLHGGSYGSILWSNFESNTPAPISIVGMLPAGYAFQKTDGEQEFVPYKTTLEYQTDFANVTVVDCPHSMITDGTCDYCGKTGIAATLGTEIYSESDLYQAFHDWPYSKDTLTLHKDCRLSANITWYQVDNGTLDLNGHTLMLTGENTSIEVSGGSSVTIVDNSESGDGKIDGRVWISWGSLTLESGEITSLDVSNMDIDPVTVKLRGGKVKSSASSGNVLVYRLLEDGYYLEGSALLATFSGGPYAVKKANITIGGEKTGEIAIGKNIVNIPVSLTIGDTSTTAVQFDWYRVGTDKNAPIKLASVEAAVTDGVADYDPTKAEKSTGAGWDSLAQDTDYTLVCMATGMAGAEVSWQAALTGYTLHMLPPSIEDAVITFADGAQERIFWPDADNNSVGKTEMSSVADNYVVTLNGTKLTEGTDYTVSGNVATGIGTQVLTITGIASKYSGTKTAPWTVVPHTLAMLQINQCSKQYDGTVDLPVGAFVDYFDSLVTNYGTQIKLKEGTDYVVTDARFDTPDASDQNKVYRYTVELKNPNYVFADGSRVQTVVYGESAHTTVSVIKADAPTAESGALTVYNQSKKTYEVDLLGLLPKLNGSKSYGTITGGTVTAVALNDGYYNKEVDGAKIENGKLLLPIESVSSSTTGKIGTVTVTVTTTNYQNITLTIDVSAANQPSTGGGSSSGSTTTKTETTTNPDGSTTKTETKSDGTVAVIVHPDGTEEIVKDSVPTEDGVQLTVDGSTTIKIIDNSKDFIDTRDHWSRDEVNFVASREIFNGVGGNLFGVNQPMTRGMVNTVLARLAGVDTTPSAGQKWYEVGTAWAKANGISDGTNPEASVTREQLATLLYRFSGTPEVNGALSFNDAHEVSDYAQSALLWATQNGILNGVGSNRVAPGADAQRAQVAAMMARYLRNVG